MAGKESLLPLREIKEAAQAYADVTERTGPYSVVTPAAVLALVEAVERARCLAIPWVVDAADAGDQTAEGDLRRLRKAFAAFDFEGTTDE